MATWKCMIEKEMKDRGDSWENIIAIKLSETTSWGHKKVDKHNWHTEEFDDGFGAPNGASFIIWTKKYIYFTITYDGSEWCASLPRSPHASEKPIHHGG